MHNKKTLTFIKSLSFLGYSNPKKKLYDNYDLDNIVYKSEKSKIRIYNKLTNTYHELYPSEIRDGKPLVDSNEVGRFVSYKKVRKYIKDNNIRSYDEWDAHHKTGVVPDNIPMNLRNVYGYDFESHDLFGFVCDKDFNNYLCETRPSNTLDGFYLPFDEAKTFTSSLGIKGIHEWEAFTYSSKMPYRLPKSLYQKYKSYISSVSEMFGDSYIILVPNKNFPTYDEAVEIVRSHNIVNKSDYSEKCRNKSFGIDVPTMPEETYKSSWISWPHFLGTFGNGKHRWTPKLIVMYLESLEDELNNLDSIELLTIINSNKLNVHLRNIDKINDLLTSSPNSDNRRRVLKSIKDTYNDYNGDELETNVDNNDKLEVSEDYVISDSLVSCEPIKELMVYDNNQLVASLDDENIDFLLKNQLNKLWNNILNGDVDVDVLRNTSGGKNFTLIKNMFFDEYDIVVNIEIGEDYCFENELNLMQKLIAYRLSCEYSYGNWSAPGSGKTLSAIFASRYLGVKNTLIICNNSTVDGWVKSIHSYYNNSNVYVKRELDDIDSSLYNVIDRRNISIPTKNNNYILFNYETFQQGDAENIISGLLDNFELDFIVLDEIQNVKHTSEKDESIRRSVVSKLLHHARQMKKSNNGELYLLAMSATPIINNLVEPKTLLTLLTGIIQDGLLTRDTIPNGVEMYKALTRHGLRYKPKYNISVKTNLLEINGKHLISDILSSKKGSIIELEKILLNDKLKAIKKYINKGTMIYTHYVTDIIYEIGNYIKSMGFTVGYYTGVNKSGLSKFKNGKIDVLIGSSPVGTGVDGLQKVCNTLIPIILPWTASEYDQLIGRIARQGSIFNRINVYIPQVVINKSCGEKWSWDLRKYNIIRYKATLVDLTLDGKIPTSLLPSKTTMLENAKVELSEWTNRIKTENIVSVDDIEVVGETLSSVIEPFFRKQKLGDFSTLNKKWSTSNSKNIFSQLSNDNTEWIMYHELFAERKKSWPEIPVVEISTKIKRSDFVVGDFGCGDNSLSKIITNKIYSFDYVPIDDSVISCDIKDVPIGNETLDVAVFSLSLMGSNYEDYLKEAHRTLKNFGVLHIAEPLNKWRDNDDILISKLENNGFKCFNKNISNNKFIYVDAIKV